MAAVVSSLASVGHAFDGKEHVYISNIAFQVAVFRANDAGKVKTLEGEPADTWDRLPFRKVPPPFSYGDLVALVDSIKDIQPIFDNPPNFGYPKVDSDVDWDHLRKLGGDFFRWAEAAHTNENHFQGGALTGHWLSHKQAISLAGQGDLLAALIVEAYADHFLEDFFAPGHAATPRSGFVDFASAAFHDHYNYTGLPFKFGNKTELLVLIAQMSAVIRDRDFRFPVPVKGSKLRLDADDFDKLSHVVDNNRDFLFYGDSSLDHHKEQAAFIVTVVSDSIEEVLDSFFSLKQKSKFDDVCFSFASESPCEKLIVSSSPDNQLMSIAMHYGGFDLSSVSPPIQPFYPLDLLLVSGYTESHTSNKASSGARSGIGIESVIASFMPIRGRGPLIFRKTPPALLWGVSRTWEHATPLDGVHLRYIFAFPRINTQLSVRSGLQQVLQQRRKIWQNVSEARIEMGFGLIYIHLGTEVVGGEGNFVRNIRSGVTVMVPRSLWLKSDRCQRSSSGICKGAM